MATAATPGYPIVLAVDDGTLANYTTIAEVKDIAGPGFHADIAEATNHDSSNGWKEYISTLNDGQNVTFPVNFLPTDGTQDGNTGLFYLLLNRIRRNYRLTFSDDPPSELFFDAIVTDFGVDSPVAGISGASITLKVTGEPTGDGTWLPAAV